MLLTYRIYAKKIVYQCKIIEQKKLLQQNLEFGNKNVSKKNDQNNLNEIITIIIISYSFAAHLKQNANLIACRNYFFFAFEFQFRTFFCKFCACVFACMCITIFTISLLYVNACVRVQLLINFLFCFFDTKILCSGL